MTINSARIDAAHLAISVAGAPTFTLVSIVAPFANLRAQEPGVLLQGLPRLLLRGRARVRRQIPRHHVQERDRDRLRERQGATRPRTRSESGDRSSATSTD
jgi:hypothetical protein